MKNPVNISKTEQSKTKTSKQPIISFDQRVIIMSINGTLNILKNQEPTEKLIKDLKIQLKKAKKLNFDSQKYIQIPESYMELID